MKTRSNPDALRWGRYAYLGVLYSLAFIIVVLFGACFGDDPEGPVLRDPPVIHSVDTTVVAPGDTLTITGKKFATPTSANRVTFNNQLGVAVPYSATTTSMSVVVPQYAATGPMTVTSEGVKSDPVTIEVVRNVGDVWVTAWTGLNYTLKLPDPTGTSRYLVVPHSATSVRADFLYIITPGTSSAYPTSRKGITLLASGAESFVYRFERNIRQAAVDYLKQHGASKRFSPNRVSSQVPPDTTTFYVLNSTDPGASINPNYYTTVTAALRYTGSKVLIYSDIDEPPLGYNQADYNNMGQQFNTQIHPTDVTAFGNETDIDGNNRVVILFSRVVNELTSPAQAPSGFIAGFFLLNDLGPGVYPAGTTNGMEIFYVFVPDPTGEIWTTPAKNIVMNYALETLAHEFQHMISCGYRFVTLGGGTKYDYLQVLWLEEGMAHIAEDLNNMNTSNITRANLYLADPGATSLMGEDQYDDSLPLRGGMFLLLRYLGDQLGNSIYKSIIQSSYIGMPCIENVTGRNFFLSVADFFATLYLSNNTSVPHDTKYDYASINYPANYSLPLITTRSVSQGQFNGTVRNVAADYYIIENISAPALTLTVNSVSTTAAMRLLITRIQ